MRSVDRPHTRRRIAQSAAKYKATPVPYSEVLKRTILNGNSCRLVDVMKNENCGIYIYSNLYTRFRHYSSTSDHTASNNLAKSNIIGRQPGADSTGQHIDFKLAEHT